MAEWKRAERLQPERGDLLALEAWIETGVVDDDCRACIRGRPGQPLADEKAGPRSEGGGPHSTEALQGEQASVREPELGRLRRRDGKNRLERLVEHVRQLDRGGRRAPDGEECGQLGVLPVRAREEIGELAVLVEDARFEALDEGEHDRCEREDAQREQTGQEEDSGRLVQPIVQGRPQQDHEHEESCERQHDREPLQACEVDDLRRGKFVAQSSADGHASPFRFPGV